MRRGRANAVRVSNLPPSILFRHYLLAEHHGQWVVLTGHCYERGQHTETCRRHHNKEWTASGPG